MSLPHRPSRLAAVTGFPEWRARVEALLRTLDSRIVEVGARSGGGGTGPQGPAGTITINGTTTVAAGTPASVENTGTPQAALLQFYIPQGPTGAPGSNGAAATIAVGSVTTGAAGTAVVVTNSGTTAAAILNFTIPRGDKGDPGTPGAAATVAAGSTTTGAPGTAAAVTNAGTSAARILNFTIPEGQPGAPGSKWIGVTGLPGTGVGVVGDWAIDTTTGQTYEKTGTVTWTVRGNLTGPSGAATPGTRREVALDSRTTNAPASPAASGVEFNVLTATIPNPVNGRAYRVEAEVTLIPGTSGQYDELKLKWGAGASTGGAQFKHAFVDHRLASRTITQSIHGRFIYTGTTGAANINVVLTATGQSGTLQAVAQSDRPSVLYVDEVL